LGGRNIVAGFFQEVVFCSSKYSSFYENFVYCPFLPQCQHFTNKWQAVRCFSQLQLLELDSALAWNLLVASSFFRFIRVLHAEKFWQFFYSIIPCAIFIIIVGKMSNYLN